MTFELKFILCVAIFSILFSEYMAPTNSTLIRCNCDVNSHHVVTVVLEEAGLKPGTQPVSNMMIFITVSEVENAKKQKIYEIR